MPHIFCHNKHSFIPESVPEILLLVSLNIEAILQETTISRRRQKLMAMTNGLGDAYARPSEG
ncbi:hypothetical protein L873DRAFT_502581 [Choiromyces venosus 120613-1]|uniref:Uncharacterized protein n=1 Tax=Choiromyces venosus 120613-1 TaxID=1336337 RepID=A0A3N4IW73_9PEZI|nr:hypothetical protein L873DRAFT_502581 [Choiromyces venosus 120613-1]